MAIFFMWLLFLINEIDFYCFFIFCCRFIIYRSDGLSLLFYFH